MCRAGEQHRITDGTSIALCLVLIPRAELRTLASPSDLPMTSPRLAANREGAHRWPLSSLRRPSNPYQPCFHSRRPDKSSLRKGGFILAPGLRVQSSMVGKAGHSICSHFICRQEAKRGEDRCSTQPRHPGHRMEPSTSSGSPLLSQTSPTASLQAHPDVCLPGDPKSR